MSYYSKKCVLPFLFFSSPRGSQGLQSNNQSLFFLTRMDTLPLVRNIQRRFSLIHMGTLLLVFRTLFVLP